MPVHEAIAMIFVTIAFFVGVTTITNSVLRHRREMAQIKSGQSDREGQLALQNGELRETVSLMQDRIAVLEQIATDPARRTADEIEKLR